MHLDDFINKETNVIVEMGAILGFLIVMIILIVSVFYQVKTPDVVNFISGTIVGAPFITLALCRFKNKDNDNNKP